MSIFGQMKAGGLLLLLAGGPALAEPREADLLAALLVEMPRAEALEMLPGRGFVPLPMTTLGPFDLGAECFQATSAGFFVEQIRVCLAETATVHARPWPGPWQVVAPDGSRTDWTPPEGSE